MREHRVELAARNISALNLPANLDLLEIRDQTGRMYCTLWQPSDELAQAALWEAVRHWNLQYGQSAMTAPSLEIKAWSS